MTDSANPPPPAAGAHPFTMDGHEDAIYYALAHGGSDQFDRGWAGAQLDLPGLRAGQVDAAFWAIFTSGEARADYEPGPCVAEVDAQLDGYRTWLAANAAYRSILSAADLQAVAADAARAGDGAPAPFGVLLHCEGARGIAGLDHLQALHAL